MTARAHIAGNAIVIRGHLRQRCLWCGSLLLDRDVPPGSPFRAWPLLSVVEVDGNQQRVLPVSASAFPPPPNACSADAIGNELEAAADLIRDSAVLELEVDPETGAVDLVFRKDRP